jgi:predicted nucleotidyltransferase
MDREEVLAILRDQKGDLKDQGVKSLAVFGSVARGDFSAQSDLDLLVEFERPVGLFDFIRLKNYLEKSTGRRVDLVTPDALHPRMRDRILKEAIYVR